MLYGIECGPVYLIMCGWVRAFLKETAEAALASQNDGPSEWFVQRYNDLATRGTKEAPEDVGPDEVNAETEYREGSWSGGVATYSTLTYVSLDWWNISDITWCSASLTGPFTVSILYGTFVIDNLRCYSVLPRHSVQGPCWLFPILTATTPFYDHDSFFLVHVCKIHHQWPPKSLHWPLDPKMLTLIEPSKQKLLTSFLYRTLSTLHEMALVTLGGEINVILSQHWDPTLDLNYPRPKSS